VQEKKERYARGRAPATLQAEVLGWAARGSHEAWWPPCLDGQAHGIVLAGRERRASRDCHRAEAFSATAVPTNMWAMYLSNRTKHRYCAMQCTCQNPLEISAIRDFCWHSVPGGWRDVTSPAAAPSDPVATDPKGHCHGLCISAIRALPLPAFPIVLLLLLLHCDTSFPVRPSIVAALSRVQLSEGGCNQRSNRRAGCERLAFLTWSSLVNRKTINEWWNQAAGSIFQMKLQ